MKYLLLLLVALFGLNPISASKNIAINTKGDEVYSYFPLCTDYLEFSVKASKDVFIILTNEYGFTRGIYEIIFGGWTNTKSVIIKEGAVKDTSMLGNMAGDQFETVWVAINASSGTIKAGKGTARESSLEYEDPSFVKMSYFGITTKNGSAGLWNFSVDLLQCADRGLLEFLKTWALKKTC